MAALREDVLRPSAGAQFGRIIGDLDLTGPLDAGAAARLRAATMESRVFCIRGAVLEPAAFLQAARALGTPQIQVLRDRRLPDFPDISLISNTQRNRLGDNKAQVIGLQWHTDDSYLAVPCSLTLLHALVVPESGGDTMFTDMVAAYEALPGVLKGKVATLHAVHKYLSRRNVSPVPVRSAEEEAETPDVLHPLVRTHPQTGRKALYINPNRIDHIAGLPLDEGDALLDELIAHATQSQFVYRHQWRAGDLIVWDNRVTMHRVMADFGDARRDMLRILLRGSAPC
jgi:taurine dioxygenase